MGYRIECDTVEEFRALLVGIQSTTAPVQNVSERPEKFFVERTAANDEAIRRATSDWLPVKTTRTAAELGITAEELARAQRRTSDVASLSQPIPAFEDDPLGAEQAAEGPGLTDKARAEFAQATAPKGDEHAS